MLASLRTYKDSGEIERIRHATDASIAAHFAAMHTVKPGVTERESLRPHAVRVGETRL